MEAMDRRRLIPVPESWCFFMKFFCKTAAVLAALLTLSGCGFRHYDPQVPVLAEQPEYSVVIEDGTPPPVSETTAKTEAETSADTSAAATTETSAAETTETTAEASAETVTAEYTDALTVSDAPYEVEVKIDRDGVYTTKDDVALYLYTYGELPRNFITKKEAQKLGWEGGSLEPYAPGCCIGGSFFGNYEGMLPEKKGREYHECDINTLGKKSRGAERLVYSNDGLIYYTGDHYKSFELLYGEE